MHRNFDYLEGGHRELFDVRCAGLQTSWRRAAELSANQAPAAATVPAEIRRRWLTRAGIVVVGLLGVGIVQSLFSSGPAEDQAP